MRAGQQLVFGEQIGWISPNILKEKEPADFLRKMAQTRYKLIDYFKRKSCWATIVNN